MSTLADLLVGKTRDEREAQLMAALNGAQFPVTDWFVGAVARTILKMITTGLVDFDSLVPQIAAGGFIGPFAIGDKVYPFRDWLELLAAEVFSVTPAQATFCKQRINLWCAVGAGPYPINTVGQLTAKSGLDDRYTNLTTGTVPIGTLVPTKIALDFIAESPGAIFNQDTAGTIRELITPLPGLLIANEPLDFGGLDSSGRAARNGTGTGTVTPQDTVAGVAPTGNRNFTITITNAGQVGAAVASMVVDDGSVKTTVPLSPIPASLDAGNGVTIAFANGGQNPSFLADDVYTFSTPGSPIINPGTDAESDDSLRARMRARWPELAVIPTEDKYAGWIRQASIDNGYGVTKITTQPSVVVAGQTDILVATDAGGVPGGVVAALQSYVDVRDGITDLANVQSAVVKTVAAGGTATLRTATAAATRRQAKLNWQKYNAALPIGGSPPDKVVRLAALEQAIMDAGAVDVDGLTLEGSASNLALADNEVAVPTFVTDGTNPWQDITWAEVP